MADKPKTIGQAIDLILEALNGLSPAERMTVLNTVTAHLGVTVKPQTSTNPSSIVVAPLTQGAEKLTPPQTVSSSITSPTLDIRSLKQQKNPDSANQMACIVGYYLQEIAAEGERSETFGTTELERYFKQAGYPLPGDIGQVLRDCKRAGYLESASRGVYKLNAVGYNLVAHKLPKSGGND